MNAPSNNRIWPAHPHELVLDGGVVYLDNNFFEQDRLPSTDEIHAEAAAKINDIVRAPSPFFPDYDSSIQVVKVEFGVGKTRATAQAMVEAVHEGRNTGDRRPILFVGPTHNQLAEVKREIESIARERGVAVKVGHYFSQSANTKPDGVNTPCLRKAEVDDLLSLGGTAKTLCGTKASGYCSHSRLHDNAKEAGLAPCLQNQGLMSLKDADIILMAGDSATFEYVPGPIKEAAKERAFWLPIPACEGMNENERKAYFKGHGEPNRFRLIVLDEFAPQEVLQKHSDNSAPKIGAFDVDLIASARELNDNAAVNAEVVANMLDEDNPFADRDSKTLRTNMRVAFDLLKQSSIEGRRNLTAGDVLKAPWMGGDSKRGALICASKLIQSLRPKVGSLPSHLSPKDFARHTRLLSDHMRDIQACGRVFAALISIARNHETPWREAIAAGVTYQHADAPMPEIKIKGCSKTRPTKSRLDLMVMRQVSETIKGTPVLMLDATADHDFNRKILPNYEVAFDRRVEPNENVDHYHVQGANFSHSKLSWNPEEALAAKRDGTVLQLKSSQREIIRLVWHAHASRGGITLVVLPKAFADYLRENPDRLPPILHENMTDEEARDAEGVVLMHFGDTRGRNGGKHARTHLQFGRQLMTRSEAERMAAVIHQKPLDHFEFKSNKFTAHIDADGDVTVMPHDMWPHAPHRFNTTEGTYWYDDVPIHPDEAVMQIFHAVTVDEFEQALGRSRANRRTADNPLLIISGGDVPLRIPVTAPISKYELQAIADSRFTTLAQGLYVDGHWVGGHEAIFDALTRDGDEELAVVMLCESKDPSNSFTQRKPHNSAIESIERAVSYLSFQSSKTIEDANALLAGMPVARHLLNLEGRQGYVPVSLKGPNMQRACTAYGPGPEADLIADLSKRLPEVEIGRPSQRNKKTKAENDLEIMAAKQAIITARRAVKEVAREIHVSVDGTVHAGGITVPGVVNMDQAVDFLRPRLNDAGPNGATEQRITPRLTDELRTFAEVNRSIQQAEEALAIAMMH